MFGWTWRESKERMHACCFLGTYISDKWCNAQPQCRNEGEKKNLASTTTIQSINSRLHSIVCDEKKIQDVFLIYAMRYFA